MRYHQTHRHFNNCSNSSKTSILQKTNSKLKATKGEKNKQTNAMLVLILSAPGENICIQRALLRLLVKSEYEIHNIVPILSFLNLLLYSAYTNALISRKTH